MPSELMVVVRPASEASPKPPEVAPRGHSWFKLDNAENFQRYSRWLPFILGHGWGIQVNLYSEEMRRIVKEDVFERVGSELVAFLAETFDYRSELTRIQTPALQQANSFARDQVQFVRVEHHNRLIPPEAFERLERVESWLIEQGIKETERELVKPLVWESSPTDANPTVHISFGQWLVPVYG